MAAYLRPSVCRVYRLTPNRRSLLRFILFMRVCVYYESEDKMKIIEDVYMVGGGIYGIGISSNLDCNIFIIDGGDDMMIIDAGVGVETELIIKNIEKEGLDTSKLTKLLLTHTHLDHAGGSANIKKALDPEIYVSDIEADNLVNGDEDAIGLTLAKKAGIYPESYCLTAVNVDHRLKGGENITVGKYSVRAIPTPGHSRGSVSVLLKTSDKNVLFSGDTVFFGGTLGLLNMPDSSLTEYKVGVGNLKGLSVDALLPSHSGFTIGNGQAHIDMAIEALNGLGVPKMFL